MNVKLGNKVITDINTVQLEDADNAGSYIDFKAEGGGRTAPCN